ncbi:hypothetical protein Tco_0400225 [Tanacetum coccineum]
MYPRYQNYSFVRNDWVITINPKTVVTELLFAEEAAFKEKAWIVSIRALVSDRTQRKMLIDTVARVTSGGYTTCELWLRDLTAPNSLSLQTTSPQNLSTNKENITPLQTPCSYGSTSLGSNIQPLKKKQYDKSRYQRRKEKNIAGENANMKARTIEGTSQTVSAFTHETNIDARHGSNILLPLFDQEYNQTMNDPTIQKKKQYDKIRYQWRKEKFIAAENANMEARTMEGITQNLSALTRKTIIDDRTVNNLLLTLLDQELNQTITGTEVGEDPTIQKNRKYNKSYYQHRKEQNNFQGTPYDFVYNGLPKEHSLLKEQPPCVHCGSKKIQYQFLTFSCMKGKMTLQPLDIPPELYNLFTSQCQLGKMFRKNIRAYNTNFSFAWMGVNLDKRYSARGSGVYTYRVQGGIYHKIDRFVPRDGEPRYLYLYFYDAESDFEHRLKWPNLDREIVTILSRVLAPNP